MTKARTVRLPWGALPPPFLGGCLLGCVVGALMAAVGVVKLLRVPSEPLPVDTAPGYLVFRQDTGPWKLRRTFALDMRRGEVRALDEDYVTMSSGGEWVLLREWTCRGPGGEVVSVPFGNDTKRQPDAEALRRAVVSKDGILAYPEADRLEIVDLRSSSRRVVRLPAAIGHVSLSGDGKHASVTVGSRDRSEYQVALATGAIEPAAPRPRGAVAASGATAYVERGRRRMVVLCPDGTREVLPGPGVWLGYLCWSPDERYLAYTYPARIDGVLVPWITYWMTVGLVDLRTGRHYRPPPIASGVGTLDLVAGIRWVSAVPDWLMTDEGRGPR